MERDERFMVHSSGYCSDISKSGEQTTNVLYMLFYFILTVELKLKNNQEEKNLADRKELCHRYSCRTVSH